MPVTFQRARLPGQRRKRQSSRRRGNQTSKKDLEPELRRLRLAAEDNSDAASEASSTASTNLQQHTSGCRVGANESSIEWTICPDCGVRVGLNCLRGHLENDCPHRVVACDRPGCSIRVEQQDLDWHQEVDCIYTKQRQNYIRLKERHQHKSDSTPVLCPHCHEQVQGDMEKHLWICLEKPVACPNVITGCLEQIKLRDLQHHLQHNCKLEAKRRELSLLYREKEATGIKCHACSKVVAPRRARIHQQEECPERLVTCPMRCGCNLIKWKDVSEHLEKDCTRRRKQTQLLRSAQSKVTTSFRCTMGCGARIPEACMPGHIKRECMNRFVQCACGSTIRAKDFEAHQRQDLMYTVHRVARCVFSVRREGLAAISHARNRAPERIRCPLMCGEQITRKELNEHVQEHCGNRLVRCRFTHINCSLEGRLIRARDIASHELNECAGAAEYRRQIEAGMAHRTLRECPYMCGMVIPQTQMRSHLQIVCTKRLVACRLGCGMQIPIGDQESHSRSGECTVTQQRDELAELSRERAARIIQELEKRKQEVLQKKLEVEHKLELENQIEERVNDNGDDDNDDKFRKQTMGGYPEAKEGQS